MKELQKQLDMLIRKSGADMQVIEMIRNEPSVFPFSTERKTHGISACWSYHYL